MSHQLIQNYNVSFMFRNLLLLFWMYSFAEHDNVVMYKINGFCSETL